MNPVILGLYRRQQQEALDRIKRIQMDIAANTEYLNPQLYSAYLSGFTRGMPTPPVGPPQVSLPSLRGYPVPSGIYGGLLPVPHTQVKEVSQMPTQLLTPVPEAFLTEGLKEHMVPIAPADAARNLARLRENTLRLIAQIGSKTL